LFIYFQFTIFQLIELATSLTSQRYQLKVRQ
jgi:hypothetical protein